MTSVVILPNSAYYVEHYRTPDLTNMPPLDDDDDEDDEDWEDCMRGMQFYIPVLYTLELLRANTSFLEYSRMPPVLGRMWIVIYFLTIKHLPRTDFSVQWIKLEILLLLGTKGCWWRHLKRAYHHHYHRHHFSSSMPLLTSFSSIISLSLPIIKYLSRVC